MTTHLEASLQHDIDLIHGKVREMGEQCGHASTGALKALIGNRQAAYLVILRDQQIDQLEQQLDEQANATNGPRINRIGSPVSAWVIPTDEELIIALHTQRVLRTTVCVCAGRSGSVQ